MSTRAVFVCSCWKVPQVPWTGRDTGQVPWAGHDTGHVPWPVTRVMKTLYFWRGPLLYSYVWKNPSFLERKHSLSPYCILMFHRTLLFLRENIVFLKGTPYCTPRFERTLRLWEKNTVFLKGTPYCTPRFERTLLFVREEYNLFEGDPLLYS